MTGPGGVKTNTLWSMTSEGQAVQGPLLTCTYVGQGHHHAAGLRVLLRGSAENPGALIRPIIQVWGEERAPPPWLSDAAAGAMNGPLRLTHLLHELQAACPCACVSHADYGEALQTMVARGKISSSDYRVLQLPSHHVCHSSTCGYWVDPMAIRCERCPGCRDLVRSAQAFKRSMAGPTRGMTEQELLDARPDTLSEADLLSAMAVRLCIFLWCIGLLISVGRTDVT